MRILNIRVDKLMVIFIKMKQQWFWFFIYYYQKWTCITVLFQTIFNFVSIIHSFGKKILWTILIQVGIKIYCPPDPGDCYRTKVWGRIVTDDPTGQALILIKVSQYRISDERNAIRRLLNMVATWWPAGLGKNKKYSQTGNRTRAAWVKARNPNP